MLDVGAAKVLARSGLLAPVRPDRLLGIGLAAARWGISPATGYAAGAARHPDRLALVDDDGSLTWRQVDERTDRLAGHLRARGVVEGSAVGLLARNGRGFLESVVALAKCGADVLYLNTGWGPEQTAQVLAGQGATALVHDDEFPAAPGVVDVTTSELARLADVVGPPVPLRATRASRQVILTSGTTGTPRGAARSSAGIGDAVSMLDRIPLRAGGTTVLAAPAFHAWGLGHVSMAMLLGSTLVMTRRFDPEKVLESVERHRADALVVVPVMLERMLEVEKDYDTSSLRIAASSGSALPRSLPARVEARFGPVLHSLYGSTEVAYAAVATPDDLRADPGTAGKAPHGVTLRVVDDQGRDVAPGETGRVFVGSGLAFAGYTDGSDKDRLDGLVATGDLGTLDAERRLTVLGRDDDMVVVGGENVFTGSVEDALASHPDVVEAAVVGVPDDTYGTRLVAHVVPRGTLTEDALKEHVRGQLARFAVPREVRFVDELPRNATGKVVKRELSP
ncbi:MAG: AMP-dependent synthetase and ligase [Frankiales bacterium]|nr:AMP-dependent synthetase and ligase [Frankiales bacterium]